MNIDKYLFSFFNIMILLFVQAKFLLIARQLKTHIYIGLSVIN